MILVCSSHIHSKLLRSPSLKLSHRFPLSPSPSLRSRGHGPLHVVVDPLCQGAGDLQRRRGVLTWLGRGNVGG